jgi:hypothetical protein
MYDTKQFRESAERCEQLTSETSSANCRKVFLDIPARWRSLADKIDAEAEQEQSDPYRA